MLRRIRHKRHIAKTITWRFIGTIDTIILSWFISGNPMTGLKIGFTESITKMILYFLHERAWIRFNVKDSRKRHIFKTITWRAIGTMDTIIISWIISGNPYMGLKIGFAEIITKMLLYYLHERAWYRIDFGLDKLKRSQKWKRIL